MKLKSIFIVEILKIIFAISLVYIVKSIGFETFKTGENIDIHFHDTYLVLDVFSFNLLVFTPLYYFLHVFHLIFVKPIYTLSFILYCCAACLLGLIICYLFPFFDAMKNGFTIYPPLSQLKQEQSIQLHQFIFPIHIVIVIITLPFVWIVYRFVTLKFSSKK